MAVPFGFSAGDFVAALHLLNKAVSALRDSDGASSHFQHTVLELEGLCFVLRSAQAFQPTDPASQSFQKLLFFSRQCYIPLDTFLHNIRKLVPDLGPDNVSEEKSTWQKCAKRPARQLQWSLQLQKHLSTLKAAITPQLVAIEILLQLMNVEQQSKLQESHEQFTEAVRGLAATIQNRSDAVDAKLKSLSSDTSMDIALRSLEDLRSDVYAMNVQVNSRLDNLCPSTPTEHATNSTCVRRRVPDHTNCQYVPENPYGPSLKVLTEARRPPIPSQRKLISMDTTIGEIVQLLRDGVNALFLRVWIFLAIFRAAMQNMKIISRLPTTLLSDNILFEDALGRCTSLPFEHFKHLPVFLARLDCVFKDSPLYEHVARDKFHLMLGSNWHPLSNEFVWNKCVEPGTKVKMSITFDVSGYGELRPNVRQCAWCKAPPRVDPHEHTLLYCVQCGFSYIGYNSLPPKPPTLECTLATSHMRDAMHIYKNCCVDVVQPF